MPRYIIHVTEKTYLRYTVEAESEEAAKQKYLDTETPDEELEYEESGSVGEVNFVEEEA